MIIDPVISYFTFNYELVQQIKLQFPDVYEVLKGLPGQRWVIAGGFISYLLNLTNAFQDIDVFYFNSEFSENHVQSEWRRDTSLSSPYNNEVFNVFNHRIYNIQVIEFINVTTENPLRLQIFNLLHCFDCVLVRKAVHLKSALFLNYDFGPVTFESYSRQEKYNKRIFQPIVTQPKTLCLLAYESLILKNE